MSDSENSHIIIIVHDDEKDSVLMTSMTPSSSSSTPSETVDVQQTSSEIVESTPIETVQQTVSEIVESVSVETSQQTSSEIVESTPDETSQQTSSESVEEIGEVKTELIEIKPRVSIGNKTSSLSSSCKDIYSSLFSILTSDADVSNLISKLGISLPLSVQKSISKILLILTNNNASFVSPLKDIVKNFEEILSDGKIDANDIPVMMKMMTDIINLNNEQFQKIDMNDMSLVLKIIILALVESGIISHSEQQQQQIMKLIDSSISLLTTTLQISKVNCGRWFPCCK